MNKTSMSEIKTIHLRNGKWSYWLTANVSNVSINVKENLTKNNITRVLTHWNTCLFSLIFSVSPVEEITQAGWGKSPGGSFPSPTKESSGTEISRCWNLQIYLYVKAKWNKIYTVFTFESKVLIKCKINISCSFKQIRGSILEILLLGC